MANKQTVVEWLIESFKTLYPKIKEFKLIIGLAKEMEKEQMIKFAQIVLDNVSGRDIELIKLIEDIYNETYGQN